MGLMRAYWEDLVDGVTDLLRAAPGIATEGANHG